MLQSAFCLVPYNHLLSDYATTEKSLWYIRAGHIATMFTLMFSSLFDASLLRVFWGRIINAISKYNLYLCTHPKKTPRCLFSYVHFDL